MQEKTQFTRHADQITDNIYLIDEIGELLRRYPDYKDRLKEFNESFKENGHPLRAVETPSGAIRYETK